ncbi:MAG TPA: hypothetical protein VIS06_07315 [Mycobacteriales bacterium]|jgi:hypothetical protein
MVETIHIMGEGGVVHPHDLPLPEGIAGRLARGHLRRVNPDGTPYTGPVDGEVPAPPTVRPAVNAPKADWVGWAVHNGASVDDAEASTKADLIEKYGRDPAPPTDPTGGN